ncbi:MAG: hypothetical protein Q7U84_08170, partial [Polynucleobacter sp.]|nr:hypothetical protein [Polynucleobacter sp.]
MMKEEFVQLFDGNRLVQTAEYKRELRFELVRVLLHHPLTPLLLKQRMGAYLGAVRERVHDDVQKRHPGMYDPVDFRIFATQPTWATTKAGMADNLLFLATTFQKSMWTAQTGRAAPSFFNMHLLEESGIYRNGAGGRAFSLSIEPSSLFIARPPLSAGTVHFFSCDFATLSLTRSVVAGIRKLKVHCLPADAVEDHSQEVLQGRNTFAAELKTRKNALLIAKRNTADRISQTATHGPSSSGTGSTRILPWLPRSGLPSAEPSVSHRCETDAGFIVEDESEASDDDVVDDFSEPEGHVPKDDAAHVDPSGNIVVSEESLRKHAQQSGRSGPSVTDSLKRSFGCLHVAVSSSSSSVSDGLQCSTSSVGNSLQSEDASNGKSHVQKRTQWTSHQRELVMQYVGSMRVLFPGLHGLFIHLSGLQRYIPFVSSYVYFVLLQRTFDINKPQDKFFQKNEAFCALFEGLFQCAIDEYGLYSEKTVAELLNADKTGGQFSQSIHRVVDDIAARLSAKRGSFVPGSVSSHLLDFLLEQGLVYRMSVRAMRDGDYLLNSAIDANVASLLLATGHTNYVYFYFFWLAQL